MEQPVWLVFGIISLVVAFGIIISVVAKHEDTTRENLFLQSIETLESQCNIVCKTLPGTKLGIDVVFPSLTNIYTSEEKICGTFTDQIRCARCICPIEEYELNLSNDLAKSLKQLSYTCYFERTQEGAIMECQG